LPSFYSDDRIIFAVKRKNRGGLAHLGERFNGIEEVSGSIPLSSIKKQKRREKISRGVFVF
jgi:hypothetical protein